jgi:hypothetical protein
LKKHKRRNVRSTTSRSLSVSSLLRTAAINAGDRNVVRLSNRAWKALIAANKPERLFRQGSELVRITACARALGHEQLTIDRLRYELLRVARWYKKKDGRRMDAHPPEAVVRDMLARPDPPLPELRRIARAPIFAGSGTILAEGFDSLSGILCAPAPGFRLPSPKEWPLKADIQAARDLIIDDLLVDFPFTGEAERAHAVALLLLPFVRALIDGPTPLHLIEKPTPGTGASLLVEMISLIATAAEPAMMTLSTNEDEARRTITGRLLGLPTIVVIDNARRLESQALSGAITSPIWTDRIVGTSKTPQVPIQCAWVATGNNPSLSSEIARRIVRSRLDTGLERPFERTKFKYPQLRKWVVEHQAKLVWAALTLGRSWIAAGSPKGTRPLGMFESWAEVMGGILDVVRIPGFLTNRDSLHQHSDAESQRWRAFFDRWCQEFGGRVVGVAELWPTSVDS